eukprot:4456649-Alexandrium_andersonii.AAC.1
MVLPLISWLAKFALLTLTLLVELASLAFASLPAAAAPFGLVEVLALAGLPMALALRQPARKKAD